jgi:CheY-like chemotaxis protein
VTNVNVASRKMPKMLIADDDPAIVRLLAERCASVGFEVETASNGIQALLRANRTQPDILIIDVNMPKADGLSVCAQLRDPVKNPFDVVVVTGRRDPETIKWCKNLGAFYTYKGLDGRNFPRHGGSDQGVEDKSSGHSNTKASALAGGR